MPSAGPGHASPDAILAAERSICAAPANSLS